MQHGRDVIDDLAKGARDRRELGIGLSGDDRRLFCIPVEDEFDEELPRQEACRLQPGAQSSPDRPLQQPLQRLLVIPRAEAVGFDEDQHGHAEPAFLLLSRDTDIGHITDLDPVELHR